MVLPITATTGEDVVCAVIYLDIWDYVPLDLQTGMDPNVKPVSKTGTYIAMDDKNINGNIKFMLGGSTYTYNGKKFPW